MGFLTGLSAIECKLRACSVSKVCTFVTRAAVLSFLHVCNYGIGSSVRVNVYLFSAGVTFSRFVKALGSDAMSGKIGYVNQVKTWDACLDAIVGGDSPEEAQQRFESWLQILEKEETHVDVKKIVAAQFFDELLQESGCIQIDWPRICQEAGAGLEETPADDSDQGFWVDVSEFVHPGHAVASVEVLQRELPEDVRSGLNWSPEKKFLFVVSVLSPSLAREGKFETFALYEDTENGNTDGSGAADSDESVISLPELTDKAAAMLVEARNSVVAAWLWQKFAASTPLAANKIQIGPLCQAIGIEKG
jgi:hypothetical protein